MTELEAFEAHWRMLGMSEHTLECYRGVLRRLSKCVDVGEAGPLDLRAYLTERSRHVAAATVAVDVRALRAFYRWRSEALECDDPSKGLRLPKIPEPVTESVSLESYTKLMSAIPTSGWVNARDRAIISMLWSSGARLSEVARLEVGCLDLAAGTFTIEKSKTRRPRVVGLTPEACKALRAYLRYPKRRGPWLWVGSQGRFGPDGVRQMLQRRSAAAGVRVTAHMFRRSVAERWLAAGGSETLLRYHAGWESHLMVRRYVRQHGERLAVEEHRRLLG